MFYTDRRTVFEYKQKRSKKVEDDNVKLKDIPEEIEKLKALLKIFTANYEFEKCIEIRDKINRLKKKLRK